MSSLPQILVNENLDNLYLEDELQAIMKIDKMMNEPSFENFAFIEIPSDFPTVKEKILEKLDSLIENDIDEAIMILFYAVSSFESMVNSYLHDELNLKDLSESDVKKIYKLSLEEKLGWLLKLICNVTYTNNENWKTIKKYVEARNFYIHYKPTKMNTKSEHDKLLNKDSIKIFINTSCDCYLFLSECHTDAYKEIINRIKRVEECVQERYPNYVPFT